MKKLKKAMRLCGFVLFLILATISVSLTGVAPTSFTRKRRENDTVVLIEMIQENKTEDNTSRVEHFYK